MKTWVQYPELMYKRQNVCLWSQLLGVSSQWVSQRNGGGLEGKAKRGGDKELGRALACVKRHSPWELPVVLTKSNFLFQSIFISVVCWQMTINLGTKWWTVREERPLFIAFVFYDIMLLSSLIWCPIIVHFRSGAYTTVIHISLQDITT